MREAIKTFNTQFAYEPKIEGPAMNKYANYIIAGMGGSHLAADLLKIWNPLLNIFVHSDYGLPSLPDDALASSLLIASSYSGNTEETLDAYETARSKNIPAVVVSTGGKLIELAKSYGASYIQMPETGIQPRMATGFSLMVFLKILGESEAAKEAGVLASALRPADFESGGKELAQRLKGFVPVIYSSASNWPVAYNWKIKFNETGKIPAFCNVFPELNHNEMTGFDVKESTRQLSKNFYFIMLRDDGDDHKITKRMDTLAGLYNERGLPVESVSLSGSNFFTKIFSCLILADWTAYYTGEGYSLETNEVPMVEEFKNIIKNS